MLDLTKPLQLSDGTPIDRNDIILTTSKLKVRVPNDHPMYDEYIGPRDFNLDGTREGVGAYGHRNIHLINIPEPKTMFNFDLIRANTIALRATPNALEAHIAKSFDCNRADVLTLVNLMRSEDGKPALNQIQTLGLPPIGVLIQVEKEVVLTISMDADNHIRFVTAKGLNRTDGYYNINLGTSWTPATDAQIDEFINAYR